MRSIYFVAICLLSFIQSTAQSTGTVSGVINDEGGQPVVSATLSLLRTKDSSLAKVAVSDKSGAYEFINISEGNYFIKATSVGVVTVFSQPVNVTASQNVRVPALSLQRGATTMAGVTVQATRPLIENKIDKMVVNVDASPANAGATAMEVLERSPGVSVDRDGNISIKGKQGIIVLMDGKQTYLSGQDLANLLRNMPASQLDQIEIMTQPSARFDAAGNSGILNLKTKKNTQTEFNGNVSVGYVQGRYPKS